MMNFNGKDISDREGIDILMSNPGRAVAVTGRGCPIVRTQYLSADADRENRKIVTREVFGIPLRRREALARLRAIGLCRDEHKTERLCRELLTDLTG